MPAACMPLRIPQKDPPRLAGVAPRRASTPKQPRTATRTWRGVAWQASNSIHVTPLNSAGQRTGSDIVVSGAQEVSGLVALDNGFALLTRKADTQSNKWNETAAYFLRYSSSGGQLWSTKLSGASTDDTAPVLDGALRWDGTRFGAYFVTPDLVAPPRPTPAASTGPARRRLS